MLSMHNASHIGKFCFCFPLIRGDTKYLPIDSLVNQQTLKFCANDILSECLLKSADFLGPVKIWAL